MSLEDALDYKQISCYQVVDVLPKGFYMTANFASPAWMQSIASLKWGEIFKPLVDDLLWVLSTTIASDEQRTIQAQELAAATCWYSDAYALLCVTDTDKTAAQVPCFMEFGDNTEMLMIASKRFSQAEQREFAQEVSDQAWPCHKLTQQRVLELIELAVLHAYTRLTRSDQIWCVNTPVGSFYIFPKERKAQVEKALALQA